MWRYFEGCWINGAREEGLAGDINLGVSSVEMAIEAVSVDDIAQEMEYKGRGEERLRLSCGDSRCGGGPAKEAEEQTERQKQNSGGRGCHRATTCICLQREDGLQGHMFLRDGVRREPRNVHWT